MTFVLVRWVDAEHPTTGEWLTPDEVDRAPKLNVETCGYLVTLTPAIVQVAVSVACRATSSEQYTGIMTIPRGCVQSICEVVDGKPVTAKRK